MRINTSVWRLAAALLVAGPVLMSALQSSGQRSGTVGQDASQEASHWLHHFNNAFNHHDAASAAAWFAADADQRVSSGTFLSGPAEIETFLSALFESYPKAKQHLSLLSARFSGPDLLVAEAVWEITGLPEARSGFATYFLRKQGDAWVCIAGRSMIPAHQ